MSPVPKFYEQGTEGVVPVIFRTGPAGCGKTYSVRQEIAEDPNFGILTATTGIAAVNLGAVTLNSVLKYFDTRSLEEAFFEGWLLKTLAKLVEDEGYKWLVIDEVSMLDGLQLDIIYQCTKMLNENRAMVGKPPLGILLTGDFCQLPPVKAKWAFEAECWPHFEAATERMTKIYRQSDVKFLEAVNHIRAGRGIVGATMLAQMGVEFVKHADTTFKGTTIIAKNDAVDNFNWLCHSKVPGVPKTVSSYRWMTKGRNHPPEWRNIPESLSVKKGAYVMILANDTPSFSYVNGDCGYVRDMAFPEGEERPGVFEIELVRNGEIVRVPLLTRCESQKEPPEELMTQHPGKDEEYLRELEREDGMPYWDEGDGKYRSGRWITGAITYYPIRLAYASTVHKTQGLTLDKVQIDLNQGFMAAPGMCYVALSRCKSPGGLRIIGSAGLLGARTKTDPAVARWL